MAYDAQLAIAVWHRMFEERDVDVALGECGAINGIVVLTGRRNLMGAYRDARAVEKELHAVAQVAASVGRAA